MSLLQRESRLEKDVLQSLGKAAHIVWAIAGLDSVVGGLAADDFIFSSGY